MLRLKLPSSPATLQCVSPQADEAGIRSVFEADDAPVLVVGVHALRSGKWFLSMPPCVPKVLLLSGTDVSQQMGAEGRDEETRTLLRAVFAASAAVVAFTPVMADAFTSYCGAQALPLPTSLVIPQAVSVTVGDDEEEEEGERKEEEDLRTVLGLPPHASLFLQPCGIRPVKDPAFLVSVSGGWDLCVFLSRSMSGFHRVYVCVCVESGVCVVASERNGRAPCGCWPLP